MDNLDLPIIKPDQPITTQQMSQLKSYGFCYIELGEIELLTLNTLIDLSEWFFAQDESYKQQFAMDNNREGYIFQGKSGKENIMRYIYHGNNLKGPFLEYQSELDKIRHYFKYSLGLPIIKRIFEHTGIDNHYSDTTEQSAASASFIHYPAKDSQNNHLRQGLKEHKDITLITILFITKPGLEVFNDQFGWRAIQPKQGCAVLNIGRALELMTGCQFNAATHRVNINDTDDTRSSIASFISPHNDTPLIDCINNQKMYECYEDFIQEQLKIIYPNGFSS